MPATICVQKLLTTGAVAILINSPIVTQSSSADKSVRKGRFDAIDGMRSIAEILERVPSLGGRTMNLAIARTFFRRSGARSK